jgi:hypothetical protein
VGNDFAQQHTLLERLKSATQLRRGAESDWRRAIADAHAADVSDRRIMEAAEIADPDELVEILR